VFLGSFKKVLFPLGWMGAGTQMVSMDLRMVCKTNKKRMIKIV